MPNDMYEQLKRRIAELLDMPIVQKELANQLDLKLESINHELVRSETWSSIEDDVVCIVFDLMANDSTVVKEHTGIGGYGEFPIDIYQFGPLFYIRALEFDDIGFFDSLDEAETVVYQEYACFFEESEEDESDE